MTETRPYPELLDTAEQSALLKQAEQLWADLVVKRRTKRPPR